MAELAGLTLTGDVGLRLSLEALGPRASRVVGGSLYRAAERIMTEAKMIVPVEFGTLKDSGHVEPPTPLGNAGAEVALGFGGPAEAYAVEQHENLEYAHAEGKQAKYLETPLKAAAGDVLELLGRDLRAALARGR